LLLGGASLNNSFFKANFVNELWLTLEPKLFGSGNDLAGNAELDINLELFEMEKLNSQGTLLLKYKFK